MNIAGGLIFFIILIGIVGITNSVVNLLRAVRDEKKKQEWRLTKCPNGQHFVGVEPLYLHCEICGKEPRTIKMGKNSEVIGWTWQ